LRTDLPAAKSGERGTVLLHVLVTSALVAVIAATLLRMTLLRAQATARSAQVVQAKRTGGSALDNLIQAWNQNNQNCSSAPVAPPDFTCVGAAGSCNCTCTAVAGSTFYSFNAVTGQAYPQVRAWMNGGVCQLDIISAP
jgi:Tfp pilus assembly protein PilX